MPVIQSTDPQYKFEYTVVGTEAARRNSLKGDGPISVDAAHIFHIKIPTDAVLPASGGGRYQFTQHMLEHVMLDSFIWAHDLKARNMMWVLSLPRATNFLAAVHATGKFLPNTVKNIDQLKIEFAGAALFVQDDQKTLGLGDVIAFPEPREPDSLVEKVKPYDFESVAVAIDFKQAMGHGYTKDERDGDVGLHQDLVATLVSKAGDNLTAEEWAVQAASVASFYNNSQGSNPILNLYITPHGQAADILRRSLPSPSERFVPLLRVAWDNGFDGGYNKFYKLFVHAIDGKALVRHLTLLAAAAKLPTPIVDETCVALNTMITASVLSDLDTPDMRMASAEDRMAMLSRSLVRSISTGTGADSTDAVTSLHAQKLHESSDFKELVLTLESECKTPIEYDNVIKILAATAQGRVWLKTGKNGSISIFAKFKAGRDPHAIGSALNAALAVDITGETLMSIVVNDMKAVAFINGSYNTSQFDLWGDLCRTVVEVRDGRSAATRLDSQKEFWLSTDKLLLAVRILGQAFEFIGHGGNRQGSFRSFITTMYNHACELANLPNDYRDKEGLRRELVKIGNHVINYAASRDATMLRGDIEEATIATPFFCQDHQSGRQLTNFQEELKDAQAKVRRRDMFHKDVNDDDFDTGRTKSRSERKRAADEQWWSEQTSWSTAPSKQQRVRDTKVRESGDMLEKWSVYTTDYGILFGAKYLVNFSDVEKFVDFPADTCIGSICYLRDVTRRHEWCNMGCQHEHMRPAGYEESDFHVMNMYDTELSTAQQKIVHAITADKHNWRHMGGTSDKDTILGGKTSSRKSGHDRDQDSAHTLLALRDTSSKSGTKGKGNGGKGKGSGKGKGTKGAKGKGGKGAGIFGRQH